MELSTFIFVLVLFLLVFVIYLLLEVSKIKNWLYVSRSDIQTIFQNVNSISANLSHLLERTDRSSSVLTEKLSEFKTRLEEIQKTAEAARELKEMLRAPKGKGSFGELSLYSLVSDTLPQKTYSFQYRLKNGAVVDLAIKVEDRILPVDSKFPADKYSSLILETDEARKKSLLSDLKRELKKHVDDIAQKYILPNEGTFDFALMFIPSEALYYEITCTEDFSDTYEYFRKKNVFPVSPNTFYTYLSGVSSVLRQLQFEKNIEEIMDQFKALEGSFKKLKDELGTLRNHLKNASLAVDRIDRVLGEVEKVLSGFGKKTEA